MKPSSKNARRIKNAMKDRKNVPYDTGKVQIGLLYQPPMPKPDAGAEKIQASLMGWPLSIERRVADWVNRSPWSLVAVVVIVLALMSLMKGCTK